MVDEKLKEKVDAIIRAELRIDPAALDVSSPIRNQVCLDSMQFIGLMAKLEIELQIELPISVMNITTLQEFYAVVEMAFSGS